MSVGSVRSRRGVSPTRRFDHRRSRRVRSFHSMREESEGSIAHERVTDERKPLCSSCRGPQAAEHARDAGSTPRLFCCLFRRAGARVSVRACVRGGGETNEHTSRSFSPRSQMARNRRAFICARRYQRRHAQIRTCVNIRCQTSCQARDASTRTGSSQDTSRNFPTSLPRHAGPPMGFLPSQGCSSVSTFQPKRHQKVLFSSQTPKTGLFVRPAAASGAHKVFPK